MSTAPLRKTTPAEFLAFEAAQVERHILWDGEVYAMAGGDQAHYELQSAVMLKLGAQLKPPCRIYSADTALKLPAGNYVYGDASIACGPVFEKGPIDTLTNPVIVVEVLSESTERFDRGDKFRGYARLPSLRHYVLLSQYEPLIEIFSRENEKAKWSLTTLTAGEEFMLEPPGIMIRVDELYEGLTLSPKPGVKPV